MSKLLPPNSTKFERNVTDVASQITDLPVEIKSLSSIDQAPDQFLSFLAWQYSVDSWDPDWQPSLQRQLIKKSFRQHQIKGTRTAVREVLAQFGYQCQFQEWFETNPIGVPGTFNLELDLNGLELTQETYAEVNRLIKDAKPASRHLTNLVINVQPVCVPRIAIGCHGAETVTIYVE
ncbi:phage tail protein I [Acinetobacter sp. TGL-Y2]|uniref:phage tail protein I n=1 Tax=Acinetobacter sp. TGL-Y2 TaxID=1407071 RepID=UPI0019072487|nr:phage tail protein I [Acinetobacter sp. TGL-Y2]MBJ9373710.1 phage tail protein I [Acinetobacter sp. TGL-Y2]